MASSQSGQAILEYCLVLMVVVMLVLSLLYKFHDSFRTFTANFFGQYVACLLEVGELPGVGSECKDAFLAFDPKGGKQLVSSEFKSDGGGGGNLGDGAKDGKGGDGKKGDEGGGGNGDRAETIHDGGNGGARSSTNVGSGFGRGGAKRSTTVGRVAAPEAAGKEEAEAAISRGSSSVARVKGEYKRGKVRMDYAYSNGSKSESDGKPAVAPTTATVEEGGSGLRPKKTLEPPPRKPAGSNELKETEFTVGAFVRWLIIICLIVAIVLFFGGQLMQISKSREKGGD